ncbi:MAG: hypothetical protein HKN56_04580 [Gammaproteobacteria bacterium]|nr:hypothetical protein [Gammaproteobacteria bacterium]NND54231.1 hypothetical protein [Gammaproteobacteria bacterium]
MCDKEDKAYGYELYRWDDDDLKGYVNVGCSPTSVVIDDFTWGPATKEFCGTGSSGIELHISKAGAVKMLAANGIVNSKYPTEALALLLAERYTGNSTAYSAINEMADEAGADAMVWIDRD